MKKLYASVLVMFLFASTVLAQKSPVYINSGAAIGGYDPVAFFTLHRPVKGIRSYRYSWQGADWYFANAQNLEAFKTSPEKYAPQYGGYCAYGLAKDRKAPTVADAWTICDGKLYLNYDKDIQATWLKDRDKYIQTADKNWPAVKSKE